mmetsp:Transcript_84687/g.218292  ORF Transcript_84687/g.218292 Transcript_84687/m.218292 type:complete len:122 (+) Transcript_84687:36-401(+)
MADTVEPTTIGVEMSTGVTARRRDGAREVKYTQLHRHPPPLRGPPVPWKEVALSLTLFTVGLVFMLIGAWVFWTDSLSESLPFTLLGVLCYIPGVYHTFIFYMIWCKVPGYSYDMITTYSR